MIGTTTRDDFDARIAGGHRVVPVIRELFADGETPVGIYRKLAQGKPGTFLLESAEQGGIWSRFSFVGVSSFGVLTQSGENVVWLDYGLSEERALGAEHPSRPLDALAHLYERWGTPRVDGHPPLTGGLVGFIGWEAIRQIEHLPDAPPADFSVPGQALGFVSSLVVLDHRYGTVLLIAAALNDGVDDSSTLWSDAQARLDDLLDLSLIIRELMTFAQSKKNAADHLTQAVNIGGIVQRFAFKNFRRYGVPVAHVRVTTALGARRSNSWIKKQHLAGRCESNIRRSNVPMNQPVRVPVAHFLNQAANCRHRLRQIVLEFFVQFMRQRIGQERATVPELIFEYTPVENR